jgi:hypothetical protein
MPWLIIRNSANFFMVLYLWQHVVVPSKTYLINFLVNLWIILFYLGNTKYHLVVIDLNYIQTDFLNMFSYCYLYKNSFISYYSFVLFYYCLINNIE